MSKIITFFGNVFNKIKLSFGVEDSRMENRHLVQTVQNALPDHPVQADTGRGLDPKGSLYTR